MTASPRQRLERAGRRQVLRMAAALLAVRPRPVTLPAAPRILVIRCDARLGNVLMLTPLLDSLRRRFPSGTLHVLATPQACPFLQHHPAVDRVLVYRKRAILHRDGPVRTPWRLRRHGYDIAIDAANPTDPSTTQTLLVRLAGARFTVGSAQGHGASLYTAPVLIDPTRHEIALRLQLLQPLPGTYATPCLSLPRWPPVNGAVSTFVFAHKPHFGILNVGARVAYKHLTAAQYAAIALKHPRGHGRLVITYGPKEANLARAVARDLPEAILAPPTTVPELAYIFGQASWVVTCDTGPMHLAVATGTPTAGIFLSADPKRFGYPNAPHCVIDARLGFTATHLQTLARWQASHPASSS